MAISAVRDANRVPALIGASSSDGITPVAVYVDPSTHRLYVDASVTLAANSSVNVNQFGGTSVTLGQKAMASSMPVVLASDQASIPVTIAAGSAVIGHVITDSGSVVAATLSAETTKVIGTVNVAASQTIAVTNAGTFLVQAAQSGTWNITNVSGTISLPTGASTSALQTTGNTSVASIDTKTPALGQALAAASVPVVLTAAQLTTLTPLSSVAVTNGGTFVVQENGAALTSLQLLDDTVVAQGTALGSTKVGLVAGSVTTNAPTFTTGQINQFSLTTAGGLRVDLKDSAANTNNFNVNLAASAATVTVSATNLSTNVAQINGVTPLMGNGTTGTGSLRVTIASDNTAFSVNSTLSAETTKVIGTTRTLGNAGAIFDGVITAASAPANMLMTGGVYNSTEPSPTTGQSVGIQLDSKGRTRGVIMDAAGNTRGVNVNASNQLSVSVDAALPAGANAIGKLAANSGVIIGDVNTVSDTPGTGATNLGKAEDAAHASGDTGVFVLGVRNDNLATTYGADQDYGPLATDKNGRVMVAQKAATGTLSNVSSSATSVTVLAANSARIGATVVNDSSALLYLKFGATASTTSYTVVLAGAAAAPFSYYEVPAGYTGIIDGIWASATGNARVTEIT